MGLIQAVGATLTTVLADQWREYFYCDSLPENVLMRRGVKRTNGKRATTSSPTGPSSPSTTVSA